MARPLIAAGLSFVVFAPIELIIGILLRNSAITTNAAHDACDGIAFILAGVIDERLKYASDHRVYCTRRHLLSMAVAVVTIIGVSAGFFIEQSNGAGVEQLIAGLVIGPASFALNLFWHQKLPHASVPGHAHDNDHDHHHSHDHDEHNQERTFQLGALFHLLIDMGSAAIVTLGSVLVFVTGYARINYIGGLAILAATIIFGVVSVRRIYHGMAHHEFEHPHSHEPPEIHAAHTKTNP